MLQTSPHLGHGPQIYTCYVAPPYPGHVTQIAMRPLLNISLSNFHSSFDFISMHMLQSVAHACFCYFVMSFIVLLCIYFIPMSAFHTTVRKEYFWSILMGYYLF